MENTVPEYEAPEMHDMGTFTDETGMSFRGSLPEIVGLCFRTATK